MDPLKDWFFHKEQPHSRIRVERLITDSIVEFILVILIKIIYVNLSPLNEYQFIFIKFGSALILVVLFFAMKYAYRIVRNIYYGFHGLPNGVKMLIWLLIAFLVWKAYSDQSAYVNPLLDKIEHLNISIFNPLFLPEIEEDTQIRTPKTTDSNKWFDELKDSFNSETSETEAIEAMEYVNKKRSENGKRVIAFDKRVFNLALARAKDMEEYSYLDHTNPQTGECPDSMKGKYGIMHHEFVAENVYGASGAAVSPKEAVDSWMTSRGHRYNLLYDDHTAGAVACYGGYCSFLGLNQDNFGSGCHTGAEGMKFWDSALTQPGEV